MKLLASKRVADDVRAGTPVQDACVAALDEIYRRLEGTGGIIALDPEGNLGVAFTTPAMPYAWTDDGQIHTSATPPPTAH
jgi:isoaspartyl peptidase/L-asparaginase-like protein (Ntn-hydrolase superfamily)